MPEVNIAALVETVKDLGNDTHMILIGRANKAVIRRAHEIPDPFDLPGDAVDIRLRRHARRLGIFLDLLPVFIGPGAEPDILAQRPLVARHSVRHDDLIGVAEMGFARRIRNRCRDVILLRLVHKVSLPGRPNGGDSFVILCYFNIGLSFPQEINGIFRFFLRVKRTGGIDTAGGM